MLSDRAVGIINTILYPTLYTDDLMLDVDRVASIIKRSGMDSTRCIAMLAAIEEANANTGWIDSIITAGGHTESEIKQFLVLLGKAL